MKTPKSFGGEHEMRVIAELLDIHIVVYQGGETLPEGIIAPAFATKGACDANGLPRKDLEKPIAYLFRYGSQDHFAPIIVSSNP